MNVSTEYETPITESLPMDENEEEEDDEEVCTYRYHFRGQHIVAERTYQSVDTSLCFDFTREEGRVVHIFKQNFKLQSRTEISKPDAVLCNLSELCPDRLTCSYHN